MPTPAPTRPAATEFFEYYGRYIALVPDGDIRVTLEKQIGDTVSYVRSKGDAWTTSRYAAGKWSPKEVIGHMTDAERVFMYRALRIARADTTPLAGFDENAWVPMAHADARAMGDLLEEFGAVRAATVKLVKSFGDEAWARIGTASEKAISVRALAYITAGHERHHLAILKERYK